MTQSSAGPISRSEIAQHSLTLLVRGQGKFEPGFVVESRTGFALWLESSSTYLSLRGHRRAQVEQSTGTPHLAILILDKVPAQREMLVPCVDIVGLAELSADLDGYGEDLLHERAHCAVH